jgi:hypothetical protein
MPLPYPLAEYFTSHPTGNPVTIALYDKINSVLQSSCRQLLESRDTAQLDGIETELTKLIASLSLSEMFASWASQHRSALICAARFQLEGRRESDILMNAQILKMILSQAVTLDRLSLEKADPEDLEYDVPLQLNLRPTRIAEGDDDDGWIVSVHSKSRVERVGERMVHSGAKLRVGFGLDLNSTLVDLYAQTESDDEFIEFNNDFVERSQVSQEPSKSRKISIIDLTLDGNEWIARTGRDLQVGVCGCAPDPATAICLLMRELDTKFPDRDLRLGVMGGNLVATEIESPKQTRSYLTGSDLPGLLERFSTPDPTP